MREGTAVFYLSELVCFVSFGGNFVSAALVSGWCVCEIEGQRKWRKFVVSEIEGNEKEEKRIDEQREENGERVGCKSKKQE